MDKVLRKRERNLLLSLLELNSNCFSNFPLMKQAYKRASKRLHPDKGGNNEKMMLLNSLWQKYQEELIELRNTQVCGAYIEDLLDFSLDQLYANAQIKELMLKTPQCISKGPSTCTCITSMLITQHDTLKSVLVKRCLVWGECYCYFCFLLWHGLPNTWSSFETWAEIICKMPRALLQLTISVL
ncbi:small t-antigen [bat polyomavirus 3a]|uniref:Small t-antigen n=1 Tax=bat polyomavirus 3a TaxID=3120778 RepID=J7H9E4_9POLY|nr:small t-antigen [Alphapolyomavirus secarplanirostris]AFP94183.1 small t-antigen [bat polyomavirus 3a-A1055]